MEKRVFAICLSYQVNPQQAEETECREGARRRRENQFSQNLKQVRSSLKAVDLQNQTLESYPCLLNFLMQKTYLTVVRLRPRKDTINPLHCAKQEFYIHAQQSNNVFSHEEVNTTLIKKRCTTVLFCVHQLRFFNQASHCKAGNSVEDC